MAEDLRFAFHQYLEELIEHEYLRESFLKMSKKGKVETVRDPQQLKVWNNLLGQGV